MSAFLSLLLSSSPPQQQQQQQQHHHSSTSRSTSHSTSTESMRQCWICFAEEPHDQADPSQWVRPCRCSGTTAWVHQRCLLDWMDVKWRSGHPLTTPIDCPQCHTAYTVRDRFSMPWPVLLATAKLQRLQERFLMYSALAGVCVSAYGGLFGYGAAVFGAAVGPRQLASYLQHHLTQSPVPEALLKVLVGVPVIGVSVLAAAFPSLSWIYPVIPPLVYANDMIQWDRVTPKLVALSLPMVLFGYRLAEYYLPIIVHRAINGDAISAISASDSAISAISDTEDQITIMDNARDNARDNVLSASNNTSNTNDNNTTSNSMILEDERAIRVSVLSTTGTLVLPFVSAAVGFLVAPHLLPFYRMLVGGVCVVACTDLVRAVSWYQQVLIRPYRRVVEYCDQI